MIYKVIPLVEHPKIKCKEVNANSRKGALIKFCKIWKIKGKLLPSPQKLTYENDRKK